jgi:hypothetical protein
MEQTIPAKAKDKHPEGKADQPNLIEAKKHAPANKTGQVNPLEINHKAIEMTVEHSPPVHVQESKEKDHKAKRGSSDQPKLVTETQENEKRKSQRHNIEKPENPDQNKATKEANSKGGSPSTSKSGSPSTIKRTSPKKPKTAAKIDSKQSVHRQLFEIETHERPSAESSLNSSKNENPPPKGPIISPLPSVYPQPPVLNQLPYSQDTSKDTYPGKVRVASPALCPYPLQHPSVYPFANAGGSQNLPFLAHPPAYSNHFAYPGDNGSPNDRQYMINCFMGNIVQAHYQGHITDEQLVGLFSKALNQIPREPVPISKPIVLPPATVDATPISAAQPVSSAVKPPPVSTTAKSPQKFSEVYSHLGLLASRTTHTNGERKNKPKVQEFGGSGKLTEVRSSSHPPSLNRPFTPVNKVS